MTTPGEIEATLRAVPRLRCQHCGPQDACPHAQHPDYAVMAALVEAALKRYEDEARFYRDDKVRAETALRERERAAKKWEWRAITCEQEIARLNDDIAMRRGLAEGAQQLGVLSGQQLAKQREEIERLRGAIVTHNCATRRTWCGEHHRWHDVPSEYVSPKICAALAPAREQ